MREFKASLITIVFIFVALFLYTKLAGPIPLAVNSITTTKNDFLNVEGVGEATAIPDTALISLGVTKTAPTVLDAQNQANTVTNKLTEDLKKLGIDKKDIETINYSINPNYDYASGRQTTTGYVVTQNLQVKIKPIELTNKAIDTATSDGANMVGGVTFTLNDEEKSKLEEQARKQAIQKAKEKAQSIANSAGIKLGRIINVQENTTQPRPIPLMEKSDIGLGGSQTSVEPGQSTISITVTLSYQTY
ncbi:MAG: SIMPL domain-containing protein [Candidatus Levybacteria bacterium]|nr:SIMPL domain-containing protein [Candidatus Levybacteria bacterium]